MLLLFNNYDYYYYYYYYYYRHYYYVLGPDFKQTGDNLKTIIENLWEQVFRIIIDKNLLLLLSSSDKSHKEIDQELLSDDYKNYIKDFSMVYSKEWSVSNIKGGMKLT